MSENRKKTGGDDLSALDNRGTSSGRTALVNETKPHRAGQFFRTVRNLLIVGGLVYGSHEVGNYKANESKKDAVAARADLEGTKAQLAVSEAKVKEAIANTDMKAVRTFYAKEILQAMKKDSESHPYTVVNNVFASIREGGKIPTYTMDPVEFEIGIITKRIMELTPNNARDNFSSVMGNYSSNREFLTSNSTIEQVNQTILDFCGAGSQSVAQNTKASPRPTGRTRN